MAATVDDVVRWLGLRTVSTSETEVLTDVLEVATGAVLNRIVPVVDPDPVVDQAVVMYAARLWKRRNSPEGVAGFGDIGTVRISALDPDIEIMLSRYLLLDGVA